MSRRDRRVAASKSRTAAKAARKAGPKRASWIPKWLRNILDVIAPTGL